MKYLSLFSGIGGFELGLENSNYDFECIGFSEIDKYAKSIYIRHFPRHKDLGNASEIRAEEIEDFDLLVGGFPCQAFSISGKRRGFDDTRGTLFFEIARILQEKRPKYFLLENVKGLLSHDGSRTFKKMLGILSELGYDVEWEILNSKHFGVPQNRERVYIKGYSRGECRGEILSQERDCGATGSQSTIRKLVSRSQADSVYGTDGLAVTLTGNGGGQGGKTGLYMENGIRKVGNLSNTNHNGKNVYSIDGVSPTLCSGSVPKNGLNIADPQLKPFKFNRQVKKRLHTVDYDELSSFLRKHKKESGLSSKELSEKLGKPLSEVEHWFRTDKYFAPPTDDVWHHLKNLLGIVSDEYDAFITEYEWVDGVYEMDKRAYDEDGLAPTLTSRDERLIRVVGNVGNTGHNAENVLSVDGLSTTINACNYKHPLKILEKYPNIANQEVDENRLATTTTGEFLCVKCSQPRVHLDKKLTNYVIEKEPKTIKLSTNTTKGYDEVTTGDGVRLCHPSSTTTRGRSQKGQTGALSTSADWGTVDKDYRIRRLTPRECERLQAFPDDWSMYGKDGELISDTQRYKCLGNAVTTTVVTHVINQMFGGIIESKGTD